MASSASAVEEADAYSNEYFGIRFYLPEGWTFIDTGAAETIAATASAEGGVPVMAATSAEKDCVVIVTVEEANGSNAGQTAEEYLAAKNDQISSNLEGTYSYSTVDATVTFQGIDRELPATITNLSANGINIVLGQAVAEKDGDFFCVIVTGQTEEQVTNVFESFTAITE